MSGWQPYILTVTCIIRHVCTVCIMYHLLLFLFSKHLFFMIRCPPLSLISPSTFPFSPLSILYSILHTPFFFSTLLATTVIWTNNQQFCSQLSWSFHMALSALAIVLVGTVHARIVYVFVFVRYSNFYGWIFLHGDAGICSWVKICEEQFIPCYSVVWLFYFFSPFSPLYITI